MIKLKLSFGDGKPDREMEIKDGELLSAAVERALTDVPLSGKEAHEVFNALVNGKLIEKDFWGTIKLNPCDIVIITPVIRSGESGQIFKQLIILAVAAVASVYLTPAGGATVYSAMAVGAVTLGATLLLNALIPPPVPDALSGGSYQDSQMYQIANQSNGVKRFGTVPKVYGYHKVYPNVAAVPYTELEVDPTTGELVQYLYAIYDFGFGPMTIQELKIGDTPLTTANFTDFTYNLVDLNRPLVDEGDWDAPLASTLSIYKGDVEGQTISGALNGNQNTGSPQSTYELIRNSAVNSDGSNQEIILNFVNPQGLYGLASNGSLHVRSIDLEINFSKVGEDNWRKWNDPEYVSTFTSAGGDQVQHDISLELLTPTPLADAYYDILNESSSSFANFLPANGNLTPYPPALPIPTNPAPRWQKTTTRKMGFKKNGNKLVVKNHSGLQIGSPIMVGGGLIFAGYIQSMVTYSGDSAYTEITMDRGFSGLAAQPEIIRYITGGGNFSPFAGWYAFPSNAGVGWVKSTTNTFGRARIQRVQTGPVYSNFKFTPKEPGQYKIRVQRISSATTVSVNSTQDDLVWSTLTTRFDRSPINTDKRHVFLELKIRATNQLNGTISNLSGICNSVLDVYDPDTETWGKAVTSNPAWVFADLLTGEVNKKPVSKDRLDTASLVKWADYCDEVPTPPDGAVYEFPRFGCNFVLDYSATLRQVLGQVASAAQASLNIIDAKYGVLIDRSKTTPVQIFTPRNSRDFTSVRNYGPRPHGLKVKFVDPAADWEISEAVAYDDDYDAGTATEIEEMTSFACTNEEQAWRFGRFMIAQNKLRQETISITVDFEQMVCTRGDFVQITQDVMRVGGSPARVKAVSGNEITIDDSLDIDNDLHYGYVYRAADGQIKTDTLTATSPNTFELDGDIPAVGDLIVIGEVESIVFDCIVKAISPNDDMSASITLVEKADAIYDYESTSELPDYDPRISRTSDPNLSPPDEVTDLTVTDYGWECADAGYEYFVELNWGVPEGTVYEYFSILVDTGTGYSESGQTRSTIFRHIVDQTKLGLAHNFKVIAVSASGKKLNLGDVSAVSATPMSKTDPPSDIEKLSIDITNEVLQLTWPQIPDCDCREYLIRYSPLLDGTWEASVPLTRADRKTTTASVQARTGSYLIKAIDFNGNESAEEALAITTIPNLFNLNVIDTITDSPDFNGGFDRIEDNSGAIILRHAVSGGIESAEYYPEGYYYYENLLDLGDIYTVRLQSQIQAEGYTVEDLMANWATLDSVLLLANSRYSEWDVETQYRSTESLNVIANWTDLTSIAALNEGSTETFTEWRNFIMGDATGRVFQFRLHLISNKLSVSPRVFDAAIRADMPDRFESYNNLTVDAVDGYELAYDPPFKGPSPSPNVQVSIEDAQSGDYWTFDYKTVDGFLIRVFDKNDVQVERVVDIAVKGFGRLYTSVI